MQLELRINDKTESKTENEGILTKNGDTPPVSKLTADLRKPCVIGLRLASVRRFRAFTREIDIIVRGNYFFPRHLYKRIASLYRNHERLEVLDVFQRYCKAV